jgi:Bleomycin resistance protein-like N-terminal
LVTIVSTSTVVANDATRASSCIPMATTRCPSNITRKVVVDDIDVATEFYGTVLGFEVSSQR